MIQNSSNRSTWTYDDSQDTTKCPKCDEEGVIEIEDKDCDDPEHDQAWALTHEVHHHTCDLCEGTGECHPDDAKEYLGGEVD